MIFNLKPNLKVELTDVALVIDDNFDRENSGIYPYPSLRAIDHATSETNWVVTLLNLLVFSGFRYRFKNRPKIEIILDNQILKFDVDGADEAKVERFISLSRLVLSGVEVMQIAQNNSREK
ncbi:MAG: hypothetical protein WBG46_01810 [Nonlabens sp.]